MLRRHIAIIGSSAIFVTSRDRRRQVRPPYLFTCDFTYGSELIDSAAMIVISRDSDITTVPYHHPYWSYFSFRAL